MATVIRDLAVRLSLEAASFNNGLKAAQREAKEFEKTIKPTTTLLRDFGGAARTAGVAMTAAFTAPILAVAGVGVAFNAMQEQATVAFTTMLGDGEKAKVFLEGLKDFAAKTPFEFPDLVRASQRLMAMGFAANEVRPLLTSVGNAVAGLGGGAAEIDRVTLALGQMAGRGKIATGEMNQLTEVGIPAWKMLAAGLGVTEAALRDMVEKGMVPAARGIEILVAGMDEKFSGMMEKQATTFNGLISTIKDESRFLAAELTEGLFGALKGPAESLTNALHSVRTEVEGWSDSTKAAAAGAALLLAGIGPVVFVLGTLAGSVSNLILLYAKLAPLVVTANTAFVAFAGFSIAAAAGVTALGAALGVGIGMLINYGLEVTGLQKIVDGFTKQAIHSLWGELDATTDAQKSAAHTAAAVAKGWTAAKVQASALKVETAALAGATEELGVKTRTYQDFVDEGIAIQKANAEAVREAAGAADKLAAAQAKAVEPIRQTTAAIKEQTAALAVQATGYLNPSAPDAAFNPHDPFGLNAKNAALHSSFSPTLSGIAAQPALPAALNLGGGGSAPQGPPAGGNYFPAGWVNGVYYAESGRPQGTSSFGGGGVTVNSPVNVTVQRGSSVAEIQDELERGIGLEKMARTIFGAQNGIASTKGA